MSDNPTVRLAVNGERRELPAPLSVRALLRHLEVDDRNVAVECNRRLVRRGEFDGTQLADGDELEIVTFVGGG